MNGVQMTDPVCPECGVNAGVSHRLRDRWLSAWRLVPLGISLCVVMWIAWSGAISIKSTTKTTQGSQVAPLKPPRIVNEQWAPMITLADLREMASGKAAPLFKPSDLRFWQTTDDLGYMCDAPLRVSLFDERYEGAIKDELRIGFPLPWLLVDRDGGASQLLKPFQRVRQSPVTGWAIAGASYEPWLYLKHADRRMTTIKLLATNMLVPAAIGIALYAVVSRWRRQSSKRQFLRRVRAVCGALTMLLFFLPTWASDRVLMNSAGGWVAVSRLTLSEVFAMSDTPEGSIRIASELVRTLEKGPHYPSSAPALDDSHVVVVQFAELSPNGVQAVVHTLDIGPFYLATHWIMPNTRPAAVGEFWKLDRSLRLIRRVQEADRVTHSYLELGSILAMLSLVFAPVYLVWVARRLWLNRRARRRERSKQCVACGYQLA